MKIRLIEINVSLKLNSQQPNLSRKQ